MLWRLWLLVVPKGPRDRQWVLLSCCGQLKMINIFMTTNENHTAPVKEGDEKLKHAHLPLLTAKTRSLISSRSSSESQMHSTKMWPFRRHRSKCEQNMNKIWKYVYHQNVKCKPAELHQKIVALWGSLRSQKWMNFRKITLLPLWSFLERMIWIYNSLSNTSFPQKYIQFISTKNKQSNSVHCPCDGDRIVHI